MSNFRTSRDQTQPKCLKSKLVRLRTFAVHSLRLGHLKTRQQNIFLCFGFSDLLCSNLFLVFKCKLYLINVCQEVFSAVILLFLNIVPDSLKVHRSLDLVQIIRNFFGVNRLPELRRLFRQSKIAQNLKF